MTNYNEKLDKILNWQQRMFLVEALIQDISDTHKLEITDDIMNKYRDEAKQAIISLIKELIEEAKPRKKRVGDEVAENRSYTGERLFNATIDEFEQNLLKALEELLK